MTTDRTHATARDVGKELVDGDGEPVGMIAGVEGNRIQVDPEPGAFDRLKARFGWRDRQDTVTIENPEIAEVTDERVVLADPGRAG